jgi:NHL repeat-containing protein
MRSATAWIASLLLAMASLALAGTAQAQYPARVADGTIATAAGTVPGFAGDGGPATAARLSRPQDIAFLADGSWVVADTGNDRIRRVAPNGVITTVVGPADVDDPQGVTALAGGGYLIADTANNRIRRVAPGGAIATVLTGLNRPSDTAVTPDGGYLVADTGNNRIQRVAPTGAVTTLAGGLSAPRDIAVAVDGAVIVADTGNDRVLRIGTDGRVTTVAGAGEGFAGDGEPARDARLNAPVSVAALSNGGILLTDAANDRVRRITPLGTIFTVAGTSRGLAGDGGPAKLGRLSGPAGVTPAPGGGFLVVDGANGRVRRVTTFGAIPPAVSGRSVGVAPQSGAIAVRPAGIDAFLPLREEDLVPLSSDVDAATGRLEVATATGTGPDQQRAVVREGAFGVRQVGSRALPTTVFRLPSLTGCTPRAAAASKKRPSRRKRARRLWVSERGGRWRTATGSVSAAAIGTEWATTLQCDGTRVSVREGAVRVRDKIRDRSVIVRAGQTFKVVTRGARRGG